MLPASANVNSHGLLAGLLPSLHTVEQELQHAAACSEPLFLFRVAWHKRSLPCCFAANLAHPSKVEQVHSEGMSGMSAV